MSESVKQTYKISDFDMGAYSLSAPQAKGGASIKGGMSMSVCNEQEENIKKLLEE